jgi:prophage antirepressor-like protein
MNTNTTTEREAYQLIPFTYEDQSVRTVLIDDAPWFVAKDVCNALALRNPSQTLADFPKTETAIISNDSRSASGVEQKRQMLVVNEPGLYRLIFQSRKPEAERFKTWVFTEVLPAIRRSGTYQTPEQGELFAKLQRMGSPHEVMTCVLMGRVYERVGVLPYGHPSDVPYHGACPCQERAYR